jgi:hypothetical protein
MFKRALIGLVLSVSAVACGGAANGGDGASAEDDAVTSASDASKVKGAWTLQNNMTSIQAIVLNGDRTFFRANARILNGVMIGGGGSNLERETGTWSISATKHTLTFHTGQGDEVYSYTYKQAIMNGVFLPGHAPKDTLEIQGIPAPMSHIAYPTLEYGRADSYCLEVSDCNTELGKIWTPDQASGKVSCNAQTNVCERGASQPGNGNGNSDCEVEEGGSCVESDAACTKQGGQVSGNNCDGSATGYTVCCDLP